jgi:hypothetical protein
MGLLGLIGSVLVAPVQAEVADVTISDVTTRAFSVVCVSDEPVLADPTVRVFRDINGADEITTGLEKKLISEDAP